MEVFISGFPAEIETVRKLRDQLRAEGHEVTVEVQPTDACYAYRAYGPSFCGPGITKHEPCSLPGWWGNPGENPPYQFYVDGELKEPGS